MIRFWKNTGKRIGTALIVLLSFNFFQESALAQSQVNGNIAEATAIVNQYMRALMLGDINSVRSLLADELLEEKAGVFSNPSYPQFLRKLYNNAQYEIVSSEVKEKNMVAVDVLVTYQNKDTSQFRLWLRDTEDNTGLRIFMESDLNRKTR